MLAEDKISSWSVDQEFKIDIGKFQTRSTQALNHFLIKATGYYHAYVCAGSLEQTKLVAEATELNDCNICLNRILV
jgi:hypothetical protein